MRFSIVLCVKNGMPHLPQALESVKNQTFRDFELVVQDGCSTDGTLDVLRAFDGCPRVKLNSSNDGSLARAFNLAFAKCEGEIVGSIDADNLLEPDALAYIDQEIRAHPESGVIYTAQRMIDQHGAFLTEFQPKPFNLVATLECQVIPPFGSSYFHRTVCGAELRMDERLPMCPDYELWLRMAQFRIRRSLKATTSTRLSQNSMSCRPESYDAFCDVRAQAAERFLETACSGPLLESLKKRARAGLHVWAAQCLYNIEGKSLRFQKHLAAAQELFPESALIDQLFVDIQNLELDRKKMSVKRRIRKAWRMLRKGQF